MGGGKGGDQESTQTVVPWAGAQPHLLQIYDQAQQLTNAGAPGYYPAQTFAPRDPLQDQAQNARLNYGLNSIPGQFNQAQGALNFALNAPDVANNPAVQGMMRSNRRMLNRNLQENLLPGIRGGAVAAGQVGGSRQGIAEGIAMRGTQQALADANARTQLDAYGKGLGAQGMALGMAPSVANFGMMPMDIMAQTGAYNRGIDQEALSADMSRYNYNQALPWENLGRYNNLVAGAPWGSNTTTEGGGGSVMGNLLGVGALGLGAYNAGLFGGGAAAAGGAAGLGALGGPAIPAAMLFGDLLFGG